MHEAVISRKKRQTVATGLSDGDPVTTWLDSFSGNNATMSGSNRPTFKTNIVNGKPVVRFTSAGLSKLNLTTPIPGVAPWMVFIVSKHVAGVRLDSLSGNDGGQPRGPLIDTGNNVYVFSRDGYMNCSSPMSTGWHVVSGIVSGSLAAQHFIVVDGTSAGTGTLTASPNSGNFTTIGYDSITPAYCDGDIAEIVIYNAPIPTINQRGIEKYLGDKYGISVASGTATRPDTIAGIVSWWKSDSLLGPSTPLLTRYSDNPVISNGFGSPPVTQVGEFMPFVNPLDETQMISIFNGVQGGFGIGHVFYATSPANDGHTWTIGNGGSPIIADVTRRCDSIVVTGTNIKLYSTNNPGGSPQKIDMLEQTFTGLAGLSSGWTLHANVLSPTGSETDVSQGAVLKDGSTYYMYYSYRTAGATLPGIRVASSPDGITWTRQNGGNDIISKGAAGTYDATFIEFHQIQKLGSQYVITAEVYGGPSDLSPDGSTWHNAMYYSTNPTSGWAKSNSNPILSGSFLAGTPDRYHVAIPYWAFINGAWRLFYQESNTDPFSTSYLSAIWTIGGATLRQGLDPTSLLT
jgi:hypothetical protein